jgi:hypothetical protein
MRADAYELKTIFGKGIRYVVPLYQRPYVWDREGKWEPLWGDIHRLVEELARSNKSESLPPHFLGAIVLDQQRGKVGDLEVRHIIDGQQRLTTLQLVLAAAARVAEERECAKSARLLQKLISNDPDLYTEQDDQFKVWPTNTDRPAYRDSLLRANPAPTSDSLIASAYSYFLGAIAEWADTQGESLESSFELLTRVMRDYLRLVVIDLDTNDNAQIIFETLNARTTPLLAIDLVKNLVFSRAESEQADLDFLYENFWRPFDQAPWRTDIRQGRYSRPRAEVFLMHWLAMKTGEEVPATRLYSTFLRLLDHREAPSVANLVEEFHRDSRNFLAFDAQPPGSPERSFFDRLSVLDVTTIYPLLLFLFRQEQSVLSVVRRAQALAMLESWLVRRMLCRLTPKNYNRFFLELLRAVRDDPQVADEIMLERLRSATSDTARWPYDEELREVLVTRSLYWAVAGSRIVMTLSAIELRLRSSKTEAVPLPSGLTIEHVLPQDWQEHWPVPDGDLAAELDREAHVNRLGNLTLVTSSLNPSLSNSEWPKKRAALAEHSILLLNKAICSDPSSMWDEACIDARSAQLAGEIAEIWPRPLESN